jgi:hypothetical protein
MSTLFLNFPFWYVHGLDIWMFCPLPLYASIIGAGALLLTTLFFLGPALATQAGKRPLLCVAENSLGLIPASGLRLCCVSFLVLWVGNLIAVPELWWLSYMLRRDVSSTESGMIVTGILVFLFITGLQSLRTSAKLALFTIKLGIAILVAALLRVHVGWPAALNGFPASGERSAATVWHGLSLLGFYVAPLALLAANLCHRSDGRKQVVMTGLMGIALPLFGTLLVVGVLNVATLASPFYQPSLNPSVAMALWGHAARSSVPGRMMVTAITMFGAVRFGARALAESMSIRARPGRLGLVPLACLIGAIAWSSLHQDVLSLSRGLELSARYLVVAGAVLTADVVTAARRVEQTRKIDWIGAGALMAGLATPLYLPNWVVGTEADSWWHPWVLPSYGVGFLVCLFARAMQNAVTREGGRGR